jgi:hypothetical protein
MLRVRPIIILVALISCETNSEIHQELDNAEDVHIITPKGKTDNSRDSCTAYFTTLIDQIEEMRQSTSGPWRYDAYSISCVNSETHKCYQARYDAFIPDCFDILNKPCLEKLLTVKSQREIKNNPSVDKMVDTSEVILAFTLFNKNSSLKNSSILGMSIIELKKNMDLIFQKSRTQFISRKDKLNSK